jgi:hypothetical protein
MSTPAATITLTGLPGSCPECHLTADTAHWALGMHGTLLHVVCPRCYTAICPVKAVSA